VAWEAHKVEGGGKSTEHAESSALDRERYLREHEFCLKKYHGSCSAGNVTAGGGSAGIDDVPEDEVILDLTLQFRYGSALLADELPSNH
jgi:hypothetical protein